MTTSKDMEEEQNQLKKQDDSQSLSGVSPQQVTAEPQETPTNPSPQPAEVAQECNWTFPDISTIFGGPPVSQQTTPPLPPSLNSSSGFDSQVVSSYSTAYYPPESAMYIPFEIGHNPHLVINHLTCLLSFKDRQLKSKSAELLQQSISMRNLTLQFLEAQNENIKLRRKMLNINPEAMTFLEDYPPEVNAHLPSYQPHASC